MLKKDSEDIEGDGKEPKSRSSKRTPRAIQEVESVSPRRSRQETKDPYTFDEHSMITCAARLS